MIQVILIDAERPALRLLEHHLSKHGDVRVVGQYTEPLAALETIRVQQPQLVFLDISMPRLSGLEAAVRIQADSPDTGIVFVTAHEQFAVRAFELNAADYLVKPVSAERLALTLNRLRQRLSCQVRHKDLDKPAERQLHIRCLGRFAVGFDQHDAIKWRSEKIRELFAFLLHSRGKGLSKDIILEQLWPGDNPDKSIRQLYNGIYHIRRTLGAYQIDRALICIGDQYDLRLGPVLYDVEQFTRLESAAYAGDLAALERMDQLYRDEYLAGERYPWAETRRTLLFRSHLICLQKLAEIHIRQNQRHQAEQYLTRWAEEDPYDEAAVAQLMDLYIRDAEAGKAIYCFEGYAGRLERDLDISPGARLFQKYQTIKFA